MPVALLTGSKSAAGLGRREGGVPETAGARSLPALGGLCPRTGVGFAVGVLLKVCTRALVALAL